MRGQTSVLSNIGILTAGQVGAALMNVAALVYVARLVGPHWFGVLQLGVACSAYALVAADWGLATLGVREVARLHEPRGVVEYVRLHLGALVIASTAVTVIAVVVLPLLPFFSEDPWIFWLYLATLVPQIFIFEWVAAGLERMSWVGIARISRSFIYALLVVVVLKHLDGVGGWPVQRWVPLMYLLAFGLAAVVMVIAVRNWLGRSTLPSFRDRLEMRRRAVAAWPIGAGLMVMRVVLNSDVVLLGIVAAPEVVGNYAVASKIVFFLPATLEGVWSALLPRLSRTWHESAADFPRRVQVKLGLTLAGLLPLAAGGVALGPVVVRMLYGDRYPSAGAVFQILSVAYVLLVLGQYLGTVLVACDRQHAALWPLIASAAVAVVAVLVLASRWRAVGASAGMLLANVVLLTMTAWTCRRLFGRLLAVPLASALAGCAAMVVVLRLLPAWHPILLMGAGAAVYAAVALPALVPWARRHVRARLS